MVNSTMRPMANSIAVVKRSLPPHMVSVQLTIFTPVGMAINIVRHREHGDADRAEPAGEHVVGPHAPADEADGRAGEDHELVAEQRLAAEHRQHLADTMPKLGKMRMYTSGCPKIQNRCCHSSGSAPASTLKNVAPNSRWNISRNSATVMTGMANTSRNWMTRTIHVKIGIFIRRHARARAC